MGCKRGTLSKGERVLIPEDGIITVPAGKMLSVQAFFDHIATDDEQASICAIFEDTYVTPDPAGIRTTYYEVTQNYYLVEVIFPKGGQFDTTLPSGVSDLEIYMVTPEPNVLALLGLIVVFVIVSSFRKT